MTREEQIKQQADKYIGHSQDLGEDINITIERIAFIKGAKWADENQNKKLVYTKKELLGMGFGFDLNGNISTPQEIEERTKKYINCRKDKWIKKACEWLDSIDIDCYMDSGIFQMNDLIRDFKKYLEDLK